jgi:hypothetical protein
MRDTAIRCCDAARPLDDPGLLATALAALTLAEVMLADTEAALGHAAQAAELFTVSTTSPTRSDWRP